MPEISFGGITANGGIVHARVAYGPTTGRLTAADMGSIRWFVNLAAAVEDLKSSKAESRAAAEAIARQFTKNGSHDMAEDYAELVKRLSQRRDSEMVWGSERVIEDTDAIDAADAIKALVKERNELAQELLTVEAQRDGDGYWPSDYQRGREAGIREAAEVPMKSVECIQIGPSIGQLVAAKPEEVRANILALLEKKP